MISGGNVSLLVRVLSIRVVASETVCVIWQKSCALLILTSPYLYPSSSELLIRSVALYVNSESVRTLLVHVVAYFQFIPSFQCIKHSLISLYFILSVWTIKVYLSVLLCSIFSDFISLKNVHDVTIINNADYFLLITGEC